MWLAAYRHDHVAASRHRSVAPSRRHVVAASRRRGKQRGAYKSACRWSAPGGCGNIVVSMWLAASRHDQCKQ